MLFVHVPKTAGTSFRKAAEDYFGPDGVCYDYALNSPETTDLVREHVYGRKDFFSFFEDFSKERKDFLSGHFNVDKYITLFGLRKTVLFVREPVQRLLSEYNHFVRHNGYKGDLRSFYTKPHFINRQNKIVAGVPFNAIGFIGLTERYDDSLNQLNSLYDMNIPNLQLNKGRDSTDEKYTLEPAVLDEITQLNQDDIRLYRRCADLFAERMRLSKSGMPFAHAAIQQVNNKSLTGWAWWDKSDEPVVIEVVCEDRVLGEAFAQDLRPGLLRFAPPRLGYVGFHFTYPNALDDGSTVVCRVKATGQVIGEEHI